MPLEEREAETKEAFVRFVQARVGFAAEAYELDVWAPGVQAALWYGYKTALEDAGSPLAGHLEGVEVV